MQTTVFLTNTIVMHVAAETTNKYCNEQCTMSNNNIIQNFEKCFIIPLHGRAYVPM